MPGNMDERVVSMEFDNKQFEKNVKTSMKTIDDLKESLDFDDTGKSFDQFTEKCKKFGKNNVFKDVDDSVSTLRKGIGLLGDSAGGLISQFAEVTKITAMFELAEQAVRKLESAVKSFTIEPIAQGFDKYTTKIGSIKTIANATGMAADKVDQSLERLNWFTDETSASFSEMVNNIGKFTSVGKGLDESITAMQGIAAWGYHSGASVAEQNRAMYNLSQALGTGSVKLIDWKSIENAGMATKEFKEQAIAAAEAAGTLTRKGDKLFAGTGKKAEEVTVENFNSTLAKGWFTSDVLMDTLKQYGSFADKVRKYQEEHPQYALASEAMEAMDAERLAKQDALYEKYLDTWSKNAGKTSNKIKEDIARINKIASVKEREKEIKAFAKSVGMSYEEVKKALDDLKDTEESLGEKAFKSAQQAKTFQEAIDATKDAVSTGWMNTFQYIFGGLDKSIELWSDVTEILYDLFAAGSAFRNNAFMHWAEEFNGWADLWNANEENGPIGALRNIADTIIELKELLGSSFRNVFFPQLAKITGEVLGEDDAKTMAKNGLKTVDQLKNWREGNYMGYQIKQVTKGIREFTAKIRAFFTNEENLEKIRNIFTSIATSVRYAITVVGDFFDSIGSFINKSGIFRDILTVLSSIANKITEVFQKFQASGFTKKLFGKISDGFVWFYNLIKGWVQQVREFFEETGIGQAIRDFFKRIEEFFLGGENDVDETGKKTESGFFRAFGWLKNVKDWLSKINLKEILYDIKMVIDNFTTIWNTFVQALNGTQVSKDQLKSGGVSDKLAGILESVSSFGTKLSGIWQFIKGVFDKITGWLESSGILPAIRSAWDGIKTFFGNIGLVWEAFTKGSVADPSKLDEKQKGLVDGIVNFAANLRGAWEKVKGWATTAWNWIKEKFNLFVGWLESSGILPKIREWWDGIKKFFGNLGKTWNKIKLIAQNFSKVWEVFVNALNGKEYAPQMAAAGGSVKMTPLMRVLKDVSNFGKKLSGVYQFIKNIIEKIKDWLESSGILPWIRQAWTDIKNFFSGMFTGSDGSQGEGIIDKIRNFFTNIWEAIKRFFSGEDGGPVAKIKEFFSGGVFETIKGWFVGENSIFKKIGDFISNLFGGGGDAAANAAGSPGKKKTGFFQSIAEAFTNDNGQFDLVKGLSTGVTKLFETIGSIDWTSVSSNVFGVMVSIINGLDDACGKLHIDNILAVIRKIISVFTGVMIVKSISDITSTIRTIVKKGKDKGLLEKFTDLLASLGTALLQIGIAIALIAGSMWLISKIDEKRFGAALGVMIGIGVFLIGFMVIAYAMTRTMGKDANKLAKTFAAIGAMFLQIAIAVAIVVAAVWLVSLMLGENGEISDRLRNAMLIVGGIMLVMAGIVVMIGQLTKNVGTTNVAIGIATFAGIAILLAVCVAAILLLQNVDPGKAFTVIGEIIVLLGAITAMLVILSKTVKKFNPKMLAGMIVMAVMLGLVVAALVILKDADGVNLIAIAGAIAIVLGVMVGAVIAMQLIGPAALKGALIFAAALVIIVAALALVASMVSSAAQGVTNALVNVMSNMAAASVSAELVNGDAIKNALGLLGDIVAAFAGAVSTDCSVALAVVDAAWTFLNKLKLASFSADLVKIDALKAVFGEDGNSGVLHAITTGLSGITETGANAVTLGGNLETFGNSLQAFGQTATNFKSGGDYATGITSIFGKDGNSGLFGAIKTGVSGITDTGWNARVLAWNLADFGNNLELLSASGSKLGGDAATNLSNVKDRLTDLTTIVSLAATLSSIGEEGGVKLDLDSFAQGIANIGAALELYNKALSVYETEALKQQGVLSPDATAAGIETSPISTENIKTALETIINSLPTVMPGDDQISGIEKWAAMGDGKSQTMFALGLVNMANALSEFSNAAQNYDAAKGALAIGALGMLAEIYTATGGNPSQYDDTISGVAAWTPGSQYSSNTFASSIIGMGNALANFSNSAQNYDEAKGKAAIDALKLLASIYKEVGDGSEYTTMIGNVAGWDPGSTYTKGSFANSIIGMGNAMAAFGTSVKDLPENSVANATRALETLAAIYEKLKGKEDLVTGITEITSGWFGTTTTTTTYNASSSAEVFKQFSEGIGFLGDAIGAFNAALTNPENVYNEDKVKAATAILEQMTAMQTLLQSTPIANDWWTTLWFGQNDLNKLKENMSGLGARLTTFSNELAEFNLDINGDKWKNVSGVLSFLAGIWQDMNNMVRATEEYNSESGDASSVYNAGYTLTDLANALDKIREALVRFNEAMQKTYEATNASGGKNKYQLGEWSAQNWENIKSMLTTLKDMTIDLKNAGLKEGAFYDLDAFAFDIKELVNELNGSQLTAFMAKLEVPDGAESVATKFAAFAACIKGLVEATTLLHGQSISTDDVQNMCSIISTIMGIDSSTWSTEQLNLDAIALAAQFISGFATRLAQADAGEGETTASGAMNSLLEVIEGFAADFYAKGETAGKQYAEGFNAGLSGVEVGRLTPVVDMDGEGQGAAKTGLTAVLTAMGYATESGMESILGSRLDAINQHFSPVLKADDGHAVVLDNISGKLDNLSKLETIKNDLNSLKADVYNLKVYMDTGKLVGEIAGPLNRKLGNTANVSP